MKFSENWLRKLVNIPVNTNQLAESLTMAGLEVEEITPAAGDFSGVVVAIIVATKAHPEADKLKICTVDDGLQQLQIVCGAPNARAGIKVPLAKVGAVLPHNLVIKKAKLRGVESFGMLCSGYELQISEDKSGLLELNNLAPVGMDFREYLELDDNCIELSITPNRGDCLSLLGLARETSAIFNLSYHLPNTTAAEFNAQDVIAVSVNEPTKCPRYCGRIIKGIDLTQTSPLWLTERLRRAGLRSINLAVDVTNYVMLELGQPMHAFDLAQISGGIVVRNANKGEQLTLLDGRNIELDIDALVIADHAKPLALAGIMGGEHSGVNLNTQDLFLESAFFAPQIVASKARSLGLHTDSCYRYERGVDPNLALVALERATNLLLKFGGGTAGAIIEQTSSKNLPKTATITLHLERVKQILGVAITPQKIAQILTNLKFEITKNNDDIWQIKVPSHRFDVSLEIDLIEEIARIYGYNNLPVSYPQAKLAPQQAAEDKVSLAQIRHLLVAHNYQEVITYSFISSELAQDFAPNITPLALSNPISQEMAVMRPNLWGSLLKVAQYNFKRQQNRLKIFEIGLKFGGDLTNLNQTPTLAGLVAGAKDAENWHNQSKKLDFYAVKAEVEALLSLCS